MSAPPVILKLNRVSSENLIEINISYKSEFDKFFIDFNDPECNASRVQFGFESVNEVQQYLDTFVNLVVSCHEEEITSLHGIVPGYPVVMIKLEYVKNKFPLLAKSISCYLSSYE